VGSRQSTVPAADPSTSSDHEPEKECQGHNNHNYAPTCNYRVGSLVPRYKYQGSQISRNRNHRGAAKCVAGKTENPDHPAAEIYEQGHRRTTEDMRADPGRNIRSDDPCSSQMTIEPTHHQGVGAKRRN